MSFDDRHPLENLVKTSVRFNGLVLPGRNLDRVFGHYVDNLFVWNEDKVHKVSLVGSAVRIKYSGRYFLLCTNHQLKTHDLENVSVMSGDGQYVLTSGGVRHFTDESHPAYLDLAVFDFTEPFKNHPYMKEGFFELKNVPPDVPNTQVICVVVAGFPTADQRYELADSNHIGKFKRVVVCHPIDSSKDPTLLCVQSKEPLGFDPDGMSGGSAFVVQQERGGFSAYFAGMVVTGGSDRFHIIKVGWIDSFLKALIATKHSNP